MLFQAAHSFTLIFNPPSSPSTSSSSPKITTATLPDDDPPAWDLLIHWCYTGKLPTLTRTASDSVFNAQVTKFCSVRLRLCCLAEKWGMLLLHNLAVDSVLGWLGDGWGKEGRGGGGGERGMKLEWKVFKGWCRYVYEHSAEGSPLRRFMARFFHYAIRCQSQSQTFSRHQYQPQPQHQAQAQEKNGSSKEERDGRKEMGSGYTIDKLHALADDIPDLTRDLFALMRVQAFVPRPVGEMPWECWPCEFHLHPATSPSQHSHSSSTASSSSVSCSDKDKNQNTNNNAPQIHVACPMSLIPSLEPWPSPTAKVQYFLQDMTLKGAKLIAVYQVVENLGLGKEVVRGVVEGLVSAGVASWEERGVSFGLASPGDRKGERDFGRAIPDVRVWEPEEVVALEDLYSAEAC
ncbi:hypothetical protein DL98DRAFT_267404 [Cadophora sp. DSE1049]|nr:hypothetical protein DL98DRAFT_267404 [Cadophora sp. DSE1049]